MSEIKIKKNDPKIKRANTYIWILSILLIASIVFGITFAYFADATTVTGDITLGDPVLINITQDGVVVETFTFSDDALPGTVYDQEIAIAAPDDTTEAAIRAKITMTNEDVEANDFDLDTSEDWTLGDDGYYYYNGSLFAGNNIVLVNTITIPTSLTNESANKIYTVAVLAEAIQNANGAVGDVWNTAPEDWIIQYAK